MDACLLGCSVSNLEEILFLWGGSWLFVRGAIVTLSVNLFISFTSLPWFSLIVSEAIDELVLFYALDQ